jgi:hypothetical protein
VSDFSGKEISDEEQSATITIRYGDGRRGVVVADAHVDDAILAEIHQGWPPAGPPRPTREVGNLTARAGSSAKRLGVA